MNSGQGFRREMEKISEPRDGVATIKRRRHDIHGDGVRDSATTLGRGRLKVDLEPSTWQRRIFRSIDDVARIFVNVSVLYNMTLTFASGSCWDVLMWSRQSYKACLSCNENTPSECVISKTTYVGHRRFLKKPHKWRKSLAFNGKTDDRDSPRKFNRDDILNQLNILPTREKGKHPDYRGVKITRNPVVELNWTKRSIFYELEHRQGKTRLEKSGHSKGVVAWPKQKREQYLDPDVVTPIIELCSFFKQIRARTLMEDDMVKAESQLIDILCNLEQKYPPAFFYIMIHLVIHLPEEALEGGPILYRWIIGKRSVIRLDHQEMKKVIWYVLHNSPEIDTYLAEFERKIPNIKAPPDIIDVDDDDDFIDDEDDIPHDLADFDDEVPADDDDQAATMSTIVAQDHGGDGGGDDPSHPPPRPIGTGCREAEKPQGEAGEAAEMEEGRFEFNDKGTMLHLGKNSARWSNLVGKLVREFPMYYPSWHKIKEEKKVHIIGRLMQHFDLTPHMRSKLWDPGQHMKSDPNHEYPSLIQTFFDSYTHDVVFAQDDARIKYTAIFADLPRGTYSKEEIDEMLSSRDKTIDEGKEEAKRQKRELELLTRVVMSDEQMSQRYRDMGLEYEIGRGQREWKWRGYISVLSNCSTRKAQIGIQQQGLQLWDYLGQKWPF
ncbi:copia protein [Tanacetum coccineum]